MLHPFRSAAEVDGNLAADGVSLARLKLLQALDRLGPVQQGRLAGYLSVAPRSVTQSVEALERDGLLLRTPSPSDRRAEVVTLTAAGHTALAAGVSAGEQALHRIFGALDAGQLTTLRTLLDAVGARIAAIGTDTIETETIRTGTTGTGTIGTGADKRDGERCSEVLVSGCAGSSRDNHSRGASE